MWSRFLTIALLCTGLYAAILGAHAGAQEDPAPATTAMPAAAVSADPGPSATATTAPVGSPTAAPVDPLAPSPSPTDTPPAPEPAPEQTATSTPAAAPTDAPAAPAATPTATPEQPRATHKRKRAKNADQGDGCLSSKASSTMSKGSTSSVGCGSKRLRGDHRVEAPPAPKPAPLPTRPPPRSNRAPPPGNPTASLAPVGPAAVGVPNFFIDKFRIPPFLLPIYQAAGTQYGIRWEVLAAINEIETDYGRNLNISSAGAVGWMQFMPATWDMYGVDANGDGVKDPFNPVDAIFAAARYLRAAGGDQDVRRAVFAYNHADWYVDSVLMRAQVIGGLPSDLVGSLTGLTQGRFPGYAQATHPRQPNHQGQ